MMWPTRYLCDVFEEMRTSLKTLRFDTFPGLIEEAQTLGNRMESALEDQKTLKRLGDDLHDLKRQKRKLEKEIKELEEKKEDIS